MCWLLCTNKGVSTFQEKEEEAEKEFVEEAEEYIEGDEDDDSEEEEEDVTDDEVRKLHLQYLTNIWSLILTLPATWNHLEICAHSFFLGTFTNVNAHIWFVCLSKEKIVNGKNGCKRVKRLKMECPDCSQDQFARRIFLLHTSEIEPQKLREVLLQRNMQMHWVLFWQESISAGKFDFL